MTNVAQSLRYLKFELGNSVYAIELSNVREILPMAELLRPPQLPSFIEGFLNIDSTAVPVIRTDRVLGLSEITPSIHSHLVSLKNVEAPVILLVSRVLAVTNVVPTDLLSVGVQQSFNQCIGSQFFDAEKAIYVLDPNRLLIEQERRALVDFQLIEEKRLRNLGQAAA